MMTIAVVAYGLVVGSFVNVLVARVPDRRSIVKPPSSCPGCGARVRWHDNVPVLSYLALRGRCRGCKAPISLRYPVVELLVALLFVTTYLRFGLSPLLFVRDWPFVAILVAVTFTDLERRLIPDPLSLGGLAVGLATAWWTPELGLLGALAGAATGFCVFYAFAWIYMKRSGRSGLGGGDIKLLAMIGAFVGVQGVFWTILVSSILGSVIGIVYGLAKRDEGGGLLKVAIPYGPFLVLGALWYYLLGDHPWFQFMTQT